MAYISGNPVNQDRISKDFKIASQKKNAWKEMFFLYWNRYCICTNYNTIKTNFPKFIKQATNVKNGSD